MTPDQATARLVALPRASSGDKLMTIAGWLQIALFVAMVAALVVPLGGYMAKVFEGERTFAHPLVAPIERAIYRLSGVDPTSGTGLARLRPLLSRLPSARRRRALRLAPPAGLAAAERRALQRHDAGSGVQHRDQLRHQHQLAVLRPETSISNLSQMLGITVFSFLSAAAGIAVAIALIRGFARNGAATIGNFWVDQTRALLYVLLPLAVVAALLLAALGVPQTLRRNGAGEHARGRAPGHHARPSRLAGIRSS